MEDLSDYRKSYEKSQLLETTIPEDPINLFNKWFYDNPAKTPALTSDSALRSHRRKLRLHIRRRWLAH